MLPSCAVLAIVACLVSSAQIAPRYPRRLRDSPRNNLVVEVSERALNAGIGRMRPRLAAQLHRTGHLMDFRKATRLLKMRVHNIQLNRVDLGEFAIKTETDGSAFMELSNIHLMCESEWKYEMVRIRDRGSLTVSIDEAKLTVWKLVPQAFSGIPFIDPNLDCHASIESLTLNFTGDSQKKMNGIARPFVEQYFRTQIEKMLCDEAVHVLDGFLRDNIKHLVLQHLIYGSHTLDYSVVADPQFVGTSLVLKHAGQIIDQTTQSQGVDRQQSDDDWMVKYRIHPDLINQMLAVLMSTSAFDNNFTVSNAGQPRIQLTLNILQVPTVTVSNGSALLNIVSQWNVQKEENDGVSVTLTSVYSEDFPLETTFDNNAQLKFKLTAVRSDEGDEDEEKDSATDSKHIFLSDVHKHYSTVIGSFLLVPLPKFDNTTVIAGHAGFADGFLEFGANFAQTSTIQTDSN